MKIKKFTAILLVVFVVSAVFSAAVVFAKENAKENAEFNRFLSIMSHAATALAKATGSYSILENVSDFVNMARLWHGLVNSLDFTPEGFFELVLRLFGITPFFDFFDNLDNREPAPGGGYTL